MISDILFEADLEIRDYLRAVPSMYGGEIRRRILYVLDEMQKLRMELDGCGRFVALEIGCPVPKGKPPVDWLIEQGLLAKVGDRYEWVRDESGNYKKTKATVMAISHTPIHSPW